MITDTEIADKYGIDATEVDKLRTVFDKIDVDGDKQLTHTEIQQAMAGAGETISAKSLKAVIRATNKNGSGSVNFQDFVTIVAARQKKKAKNDQLKEMFDQFDLNRSGKISAKELQTAWSRMNEKITLEEARAIIAEVDDDGDGEVSFEEFKKMWKQV